MGAAGYGPKADIASIPGWRTGLLFLFFAVISVLLEHGTEWLEHKWSKRRGHARSSGLLTMLTFIKQELFLLGLISMLLTAVQDQMLKICISDQAARYGLHWTPDPVRPYGQAAGGYQAAGRRLLGGAPSGNPNPCPKGSQPLFSAYSIYQVHLLIFLLAVTHVIYVAVTLLVTLAQVGQWRRWEEEAPSGDVFLRLSGVTLAAPKQALPGSWEHPEAATKRMRRQAAALWRRVGTSGFTHGLRVGAAVVTRDIFLSPVTRTVYYAIRLMFIDRLSLDHSFDFASFIERSIEEHIPYLMKLNAPMMILAAGMLSFPFPAYLPYWLFGASVLVELVLAGKLASVTTLLAGQALVQFGDAADDDSSLGDRLEAVCVEDGRLGSPYDGGYARDQAPRGAGFGYQYANGGGAPAAPAAAAATPSPPRQMDGRAVARAIEGCKTVQELEDFVGVHGGNFTQLHVSLCLLQLHRIAERRRSRDAASAAAADAAAERLEGAVAAGGGSGDYGYAARGHAEAPAAADPYRNADPHFAPPADYYERKLAGHAPGGQPNGWRGAGAAAPAGILKNGGGGGGYPYGAGAPLARAHSYASSVSGASAAAPGAAARRRARVGERLEALPEDPAKLFWFRRPSLLLHAFQFVYYSNAFLLTLASFALWQKHVSDWMYEGVGLIPMTILMAGSALLAVHSALRVLPQFALIEPIGRHCPETVLRRALKEGGLRPEEAAALAHQLGVQLPGSHHRRRRRPRRDSQSDAGVSAAPSDARAQRVLRQLLDMPGAGDAPGYAGHDAYDYAGDHNTEGLKSASLGDMLKLLGDGGAPSSHAPPASVTGAPALARSRSTPNLAASSVGAHSVHSGAGGGHGVGVGGGHGHGHDAGPSSNVELAAAMLRAHLMKKARAGQPVTPRGSQGGGAFH